MKKEYISLLVFQRLTLPSCQHPSPSASQSTALPPTKLAPPIEDLPPAPASCRTASSTCDPARSAASLDRLPSQKQPRQHASHRQAAAEVRSPGADRTPPCRAYQRRKGPPGHGTRPAFHQTS